MSRSRRRLPVALAAALAGAVALASGCGGGPEREPARAPSPGAVALGFNEEPSARAFALQARTGMPVLRFKVPWNSVEPAPGSWTWAAYDRAYALMLRAGLRPLLVAIGGPCWTRPGRPCAAGPPDPEFDGEWAEYVRRLVERYPAAVGVEVWNEPNIIPMFPPYPDPDRFAQLLGAAHDAVKELDPGMPVVLGGLFATPRSGSYGIADRDFVAAVIAAGGGDEIDAIGAHPYPRVGGDDGGRVRYDLLGMTEALDRLRDARDSAGFSEIPLWITEMGVSTATASGYPIGAAPSRQAALLLGAIGEAQEAGDVQLALIHRLVDRPEGTRRGPLPRVESGFGVFASGGQPKPAACDLSARFSGSLDC